MERKHWAMYELFGKLNKQALRYIILGVAFFGLLLYGIYTNSTLARLEGYSRATTETYGKLISEALFDKMEGTGEHLILHQILRGYDIPIIVTDMMNRPIIWMNITRGHLFWKRPVSEYDESLVTRIFLSKRAQEMGEDFDVIQVYGKRRNLIAKLYIDQSPAISSIKYMPYYEIGFIFFFLLAVYYVLNSIQTTERGNIWAGLAKETAHQLGTPLSSLKGWLEYIKLEISAAEDDDFGFGDDEFRDKMAKVSLDMSTDLDRLNKVTNRFSSIGSKPVKERLCINSLLEDHLEYFSKRLPTLSMKVNIDFKTEELPETDINYDLFSWVFENLFKNALDALDKPNGTISVVARYIKVDNIIRITHRDNGKGISWDNRNAVFNPGYSTKSRGWGLGLTLARRIVEEYHHGRIYISWSQKGKGTEFTIEIPVPEKEKKQ